jgi:hypothetical protein
MLERRRQAIEHQNAVGLVPLLPGHDNVGSSGQRLADGLESLAAHDQRLAQRRPLEEGKVGW